MRRLLFLLFFFVLSLSSYVVSASETLTVMNAQLPRELYNLACASSLDESIFCFGGHHGGFVNSDAILKYQREYRKSYWRDESSGPYHRFGIRAGEAKWFCRYCR